MRAIRKRNERLLVLALVGILALNYPLLSIFADDGFVFGIPLLYFFLFVFWGVVILLAGLITESKAREEIESAPQTHVIPQSDDRDASG